MPWWGWIVIGGMLLGSELLVATEFYLAVLGAAALTVGLVAFLGLTGPAWLQWALFAGLSVAYLFAFRRRLADRLGDERPGRRLLENEVATVTERIEPGGTGRAELRGAMWTAHNESHEPLEAGTRTRVTKTEGLTIHIRSEAELEARARHRRRAEQD